MVYMKIKAIFSLLALSVVFFLHNALAEANDAPHGIIIEDGIEADVKTQLQSFYNAGKIISGVVFAPGGGWAVLFDKGTWASDNLPDGLADQLKKCDAANEKVRIVGFTPLRGWYIVADDHTIYQSKLPQDFSEQIAYVQAKKERIDFLTYNGLDGWCLGTHNGDYFFGGNPGEYCGRIKGNTRILSVSFEFYNPDQYVALLSGKGEYKFDTIANFDAQSMIGWDLEEEGLQIIALSVDLSGNLIEVW